MRTFFPTPNYDTLVFWEGTKKKELKFQKCKNCGHIRWPSSIACPVCHSKEYEYITSKGIGTIYSFVIYKVAFHESLKNNTPYIVAIIELEEGPRIMSNIINCNPSSLKCGMPVKLVWEKAGEFNIYKFEPTEYKI